MRNPDNYSPDQFGWHRKLEVPFQTSITDETIYWNRKNALDFKQCRRELKEMLMNVLEWADLDVIGGDEYHEVLRSISRLVDELNRKGERRAFSGF